ncbi:MAG: hypothetical protein MUD00_02165 [Candidatus Pacebacteria bacterium]|jgi:hypothetical protein|nr:hypothetical protein [Candidatus Paceibacterota bacterium]
MDLRLHTNCKLLLSAFKSGKLGQTVMPEDANPGFKANEQELRIAYFTLPMALNYQRDSYKLWQAALKTFNDPETKFVFDIKEVSKSTEAKVRKALLKYKVALQPNKHINTWRTIAKTINDNWGSFEKFIDSTNNDFLKLKQTVKVDYKKGFPYLSGPKIFNYWSFILSTYGKVKLKNRDQIEIAPDTHITQCSIKLGVITQKEATDLSRDQISERWRELLKDSGIDPIDMHPPLWFWSRNGFLYELENKLN